MLTVVRGVSAAGVGLRPVVSTLTGPMGSGRVRLVADGCAGSVRTWRLLLSNPLVSAISMLVCKTVGVVLRWFESITRHAHAFGPWPGDTPVGGRSRVSGHLRPGPAACEHCGCR